MFRGIGLSVKLIYSYKKTHTLEKNFTNWKTEILPSSYRETIISVHGKLILIKHVF